MTSKFATYRANTEQVLKTSAAHIVDLEQQQETFIRSHNKMKKQIHKLKGELRNCRGEYHHEVVEFSHIRTPQKSHTSNRSELFPNGEEDMAHFLQLLPRRGSDSLHIIEDGIDIHRTASLQLFDESGWKSSQFITIILIFNDNVDAEESVHVGTSYTFDQLRMAVSHHLNVEPAAVELFGDLYQTRIRVTDEKYLHQTLANLNCQDMTVFEVEVVASNLRKEMNVLEEVGEKSITYVQYSALEKKLKSDLEHLQEQYEMRISEWKEKLVWTLLEVTLDLRHANTGGPTPSRTTRPRDEVDSGLSTEDILMESPMDEIVQYTCDVLSGQHGKLEESREFESRRRGHSNFHHGDHHPETIFRRDVSTIEMKLPAPTHSEEPNRVLRREETRKLVGKKSRVRITRSLSPQTRGPPVQDVWEEREFSQSDGRHSPPQIRLV